MLLELKNRKFELVKFYIKLTYENINLNSSYQVINKRILRDLPVPECWGDKKLVKVYPKEVLDQKLPHYTFYAWITSGPIDIESLASELVIVWFEESIDQNIMSLLERQLADIDWSEKARDIKN